MTDQSPLQPLILLEDEPIPDFKMPVTFSPELYEEDNLEKHRARSPSGMMKDRVATKPIQDSNKCIACGVCEANCPPQALKLEPEPEDEKREKLKTDAYESLTEELSHISARIIGAAKKSLGFKPFIDLTLEELETYVPLIQQGRGLEVLDLPEG